MKRFVALIFAALVACAATMSGLNYDPNAVLRSNGTVVNMGQCGSHEVFVLQFVVNKRYFQLFHAPDNQRAAIVSYKEDGKPEQIVLGTITIINKVPTFKVLEVLTVEQAVARYKNPCGYINQTEV